MEENNNKNDDANTPAPEAYNETDIFLWANNLVQYKDELKFDLYFISKNYMLYKSRVGKGVAKQLEPLFIDNLLEEVLEGVETGLTVRGFEEAEAEAGVLQRTQLFKVTKAKETLNYLKQSEDEIETFSDEEHDFKRMKGLLVRISHPELDKPFFVVKVLPQSNVMSGRSGWMLRDGTFIAFDADAALRIPADNQLLILDQDIYVFNQSKLKQLFGYDAKEAAIAEKKVAEIEEHFRLSFVEGMTLQQLVMGKRTTIRKLQKIDVGAIKQDDLVNHAEELGIELLVDDGGAILIVDDKDLTKFVNLLNDDYIESALTGQKYEIIRKKPLKLSEDEDATL
jgi:hypothetical protein